MSITKKIKGILKNFALVALFLIGGYLVLYGMAFTIAWSDPYYRKFTSVSRGISEKELIKTLGKPFKVCDSKKTMSECRISGYAYKDWVITNKAFVYKGYDHVGYFYIDKVR